MDVITNQYNLKLDYKFFLFSGGEVSIKLDARNYRFFQESTEYNLFARLHNSNDIFALAMVKDALLRKKKLPIHVTIPYFPYARQDRVCDGGESLSLKVFADYINFLNFDSVTIVDPHSDTTPALLNNVKVVDRLTLFTKWNDLRDRILKNGVFISPDAGANKKVSELAAYFNHREFIRADKLRDLTNGKIKETVVYCDDFEGSDVIIADDLCDGGATFISLAQELKKKNCGKIVLYVTHGIFSKGIDVLYRGGIDEIWMTDSFTANLQGYLPTSPKLNILNLENCLCYSPFEPSKIVNQ